MSRRTDEAELVIYVAIDQASAPLLYSDLATLSQGPKLVQRLRMLALQGLIFESGPLAKPARALGASLRPAACSARLPMNRDHCRCQTWVDGAIRRASLSGLLQGGPRCASTCTSPVN